MNGGRVGRSWSERTTRAVAWRVAQCIYKSDESIQEGALPLAPQPGQRTPGPDDRRRRPAIAPSLYLPLAVAFRNEAAPFPAARSRLLERRLCVSPNELEQRAPSLALSADDLATDARVPPWLSRHASRKQLGQGVRPALLCKLRSGFVSAFAASLTLDPDPPGTTRFLTRSPRSRRPRVRRPCVRGGPESDGADSRPSYSRQARARPSTLSLMCPRPRRLSRSTRLSRRHQCSTSAHPAVRLTRRDESA